MGRAGQESTRGRLLWRGGESGFVWTDAHHARREAPHRGFAILAVAVLVTVTVFVHATGFALQLRSLTKWRTAPTTQTWPIAWLLIGVTWCLILIHMAEITLWALVYL